MHRKRFIMPGTSAVLKALLFVFNVPSQETECFLRLLTGCVHIDFWQTSRSCQPGSQPSKPVLTALSRAKMKREFRSFPPWARVEHIQRPTLLDRNPWIPFWCIPCILVPASKSVWLAFPTPAASTNISFILKNLSHPSTTRDMYRSFGDKSSPASSLLRGLGPYSDCRNQALVKLFNLFCFLVSLGSRPWIAIIVEGCFNTSARHVWKIQDETINMEMQPNLAANMGPQKWEGFENFTCFRYFVFRHLTRQTLVHLFCRSGFLLGVVMLKLGSLGQRIYIENACDA